MAHHTADNIRHVQHIIDLVQTTKESLLLFFVDAGKAFDHEDWQFLKHFLREMQSGFFLSLIHKVYEDQSAIILKGGYSLGKILIRRE